MSATFDRALLDEHLDQGRALLATLDLPTLRAMFYALLPAMAAGEAQSPSWAAAALIQREIRARGR